MLSKTNYVKGQFPCPGSPRCYTGRQGEVRCDVSQLALFRSIINIYIQGVTGGTDNTSGGCSLGQTIPI
jgi:hypothetical protein